MGAKPLSRRIPSRQPASGRPAVAIIRRGSFSGINDAFIEAFAALLPEYDLELVDVLDLMQDEGPVFKLLARAYALKEYTRLLVLRREKMHGAGGCLIRTTYYLDRLRAQARRAPLAAGVHPHAADAVSVRRASSRRSALRVHRPC